MLNTQKIILGYSPFNEQEQQDKNYALLAFEKFQNILTRESVFCHTTSSAFIINKTQDKVLCCFHKIYQSWSFVGGHSDGMDSPLGVALKEAQEETGIKNFSVLSSTPISLDVLVTPGHFKNQKYVCGHTHINTTYLLKTDEKEKLVNSPEENVAIDWIDLEKLPLLAQEDYMKKIYKKII